MFWYAKKNGVYLNYLNLFSSRPLKLRCTKEYKEAILYNKKEIMKLVVLEEDIEVQLNFQILKN
jgi:hypothetical protein